jgi:hypothetical protein
MSFSRPIQWYHSNADPVWPDCTFKFIFLLTIYFFIKWLNVRHPLHMEQVGWSRLLGTTDLMVYKHTYWKMTNLNQNWKKGSR